MPASQTQVRTAAAGLPSTIHIVYLGKTRARKIFRAAICYQSAQIFFAVKIAQSRHAFATFPSRTFHNLFFAGAPWRGEFLCVISQRILVADDEEDVLQLVSINLQTAGFIVAPATDGASALEQTRRDAPALIVLDWMLPGMSGLEVCRVLKGDARTKQIPIIMLTAKAQEVDRVVGLEIGADDYVTKPFSPRELVLRVRAQLRRGVGEMPNIIRIGEVEVDRQRHVARVKNRQLDLTATEFKLLAVLLERRGRVQSRETLLRDVWGYEGSITSRTVDIHIRRLREKLGRCSDVIETVRGFGYRSVEAGGGGSI